jgi:hypothetical protein
MKMKSIKIVLTLKTHIDVPFDWDDEKVKFEVENNMCAAPLFMQLGQNAAHEMYTNEHKLCDATMIEVVTSEH